MEYGSTRSRGVTKPNEKRRNLFKKKTVGTRNPPGATSTKRLRAGEVTFPRPRPYRTGSVAVGRTGLGTGFFFLLVLFRPGVRRRTDERVQGPGTTRPGDRFVRAEDGPGRDVPLPAVPG